MSLIVEDGTGIANAESYCSVATADARHSNLGNTAWAALTTSAKEQALRKATIYMTEAYRERWIGRRNNLTQALEWPRYGVSVEGWPVNVTTIPTDIVNACADLALKASTTDLAPDLTQGVIRKKIGPIETEYNRGSPQYPRYRAIDMMLSPYLVTSGPTAKLVRS
jgi:hypothetical protein